MKKLYKIQDQGYDNYRIGLNKDKHWHELIYLSHLSYNCQEFYYYSEIGYCLLFYMEEEKYARNKINHMGRFTKI